MHMQPMIDRLDSDLGDLMAVEREGWFFLPKKIGWVAVVGGFLYLGQQVWETASYKTLMTSEIVALKKEDAEGRVRDDEMRRRLGDLERGRVDDGNRLIRVEEQQKVTIELLREIKEDLRKPR